LGHLWDCRSSAKAHLFPCWRSPEAGLILHSDRAASARIMHIKPFRRVMASGSVGMAWAAGMRMHPWRASWERSRLNWPTRRRYRPRDGIRADLFVYIEASYNRRRRHSSLGYLSAGAQEQLHHQQRESRLSPCLPDGGKTTSRTCTKGPPPDIAAPQHSRISAAVHIGHLSPLLANEKTPLQAQRSCLL
jgi:hypothetical protein